jgi:hypothetical protein
MKVPERYRVTTGLMGSDSSHGCNGAFLLPHPWIALYYIQIICSDGEGWQHVSVSLVKNVGLHNRPKMIAVERCPTWTEMCWVKEQFWSKDETVIQYHPPESEYVNNHPFCLHLWKPDNVELPLPNKLMVGIKTD